MAFSASPNYLEYIFMDMVVTLLDLVVLLGLLQALPAFSVSFRPCSDTLLAMVSHLFVSDRHRTILSRIGFYQNFTLVFQQTTFLSFKFRFIYL